jgi:hypothetical protein
MYCAAVKNINTPNNNSTKQATRAIPIPNAIHVGAMEED